MKGYLMYRAAHLCVGALSGKALRCLRWGAVMLLMGCQPLAVQTGVGQEAGCPSAEALQPSQTTESTPRVIEKKMPSTASVVLSARRKYCEAIAEKPGSEVALKTKLIKQLQGANLPGEEILAEWVMLSCDVFAQPQPFLQLYRDRLPTLKLEDDLAILLEQWFFFAEKITQLQEEKVLTRAALEKKIEALTAIEKEINAR